MNSWSNKETAAVAHWLQENSFAHQAMLRLARERAGWPAVRDLVMNEVGCTQTDDGVPLDSPRINISELSAVVAAEREETWQAGFGLGEDWVRD